MKKLSYVSGALATLFTLSVISACNNENTVVSLEQSQIISAQTVKKVRAKKNLIKITVKNKADIEKISSEGIDIFGSGDGGSFDTYATDKQINFLKANNIKIMKANNSVIEGSSLPAGYHTVDQVLSTVKEFAAKYPNITKLEDIGDSWEKTKGKSSNDIWALTVSGNKAQKAGKKSAVFISGMHSRELLPVEVNLKFMDFILSSYGKNAEITNYLDTREVIFIPVLNIDGRVAVENGDSMWRKNRHIDNDYDGIDLNRNFDGHWNFEGVSPMTGQLQNLKAKLGEKDSDIYSGPKAFSEPETQALNNFLKDRDVTVMMDLHAYGNMILYPPGFTTTPVSLTPVFKQVAKVLSAKNGYKAGTSIEILYPSCGTSKDWGFDRHNAISFTMEMGDDADGFRPPFSKVDKTWNLNKEGLTYLVSITDNPGKVIK